MITKDDYKFAAVRNMLLEAVRKDLIGPDGGENEIITDNPSTQYITGILFPSENETQNQFDEDKFDEDKDLISLQEEDDFVPLENLDEMDEIENQEENQIEKNANVYQKPSSIGLSFYLDSNASTLKIKVRYGTYEELPKKDENEKGKKFQREQHEETLELDFPDKSFKSEKNLSSNEKLSVVALCRKIKNGKRMATVFLRNKNVSKEAAWKRSIYQVELELSSSDGENIFIPEYECRENLSDEYFYSSRPVFARGRQCAAIWNYKNQKKKINLIKSSFIPEYEIPAIDYEIKELPENAFSMFEMGSRKQKNNTIQILKLLAALYESWIHTEEVVGKVELKDAKQKSKIIGNCENVLKRIRRGIELLENDEKAFESFLFMNQVMFMQQAISDHCKNYSSEKLHKLETSLEKLKGESKWRPFQIAFILLNLYGIVHKESDEREIVDLLFFPTGGGKTEAYLGLIAFTVAYRRLSATANDENFYNKDGGVTVILRYTLRLLTMQQRDRLLKLVVAMEMQRANHPEKYGSERISIGFWVGGGVTPNRFSEYNEANQWDKKLFEKKIQRQILKCPFCGKPLEAKDFEIISKAKTVRITCSNPGCYFYKRDEKSGFKTIPVYVVDEEIYAKCPTILISTVDKFARLPWSEETALLFGKTNSKCERCGYIALGSDRHPAKSHEADRFFKLPKAEVVSCKPFYPPELIIQDELHLITGPLGTIYGGFETVVEDMCSVKNEKGQNKDGKKILPKYIASTATIRNAENQIQKLYGRKKFCQFPPSGFDMTDSYFVNEIPLPSEYPDFDDDEKISSRVKKGEKPFRIYASVCAPGVSMKIAEVRLYAALLSKVFELSQNEKFKDYIDPYFTLIGYFNSLRELGGSVRLLNDEIPSRLLYLKNLHKMGKQRFLNNIKELTSRVSSEEIASVLENLSIKYDKDEKYQKAYDVVVATNMIAVGMDVDRLGLMCVAGQPKQNAEFIQATSRVGRKFPGLIFTLDNPYKPRDLSVYENFIGFHSQMSRYVEGNSVTPFSARARDRDLHSLVISLVRFYFERFAANKNASQIDSITEEEIQKVKQTILERIKSVEPDACDGAEAEIDLIFSKWKEQASEKNLFYSIPILKEGQKRLLAVYGSDYVNDGEFETLNSMRDVESSSAMYLWQNDDEESEKSDKNQGDEK